MYICVFRHKPIFASFLLDLQWWTFHTRTRRTRKSQGLTHVTVAVWKGLRVIYYVPATSLGMYFLMPSNILNLNILNTRNDVRVQLSQNDCLSPFILFTLFCFHRCFVSSPQFQPKTHPSPFWCWIVHGFPEDLRVQRGLIGRYHPNYLAIGWTRRGPEPSTHLMEPEGLNLKYSSWKMKIL